MKMEKKQCRIFGTIKDSWSNLSFYQWCFVTFALLMATHFILNQNITYSAYYLNHSYEDMNTDVYLGLKKTLGLEGAYDLAETTTVKYFGEVPHWLIYIVYVDYFAIFLAVGLRLLNRPNSCKKSE